jgi:hypothetical protein
LLRERAGVKPKAKRLTVEQELAAARESLKDQESSGLPTSKGHINFFEELEQVSPNSEFFVSVFTYDSAIIHRCGSVNIPNYQGEGGNGG